MRMLPWLLAFSILGLQAWGRETGHIVAVTNPSSSDNFGEAGEYSCYEHGLRGSSPSPAALSAAEGLISYAIQKGHLSPRYIQPLLLKEEICLDPQHPVMPRKGFDLETREGIDKKSQIFFLVGQDGGVYEGVGWHVEGSHTYGFNDIALGIAFIGYFVEKPPNAAALEAAQDLIQCAVVEGYLTPNYLLVGHSDVVNILSPGQALYNIISTWPHFKH
ncbi:PREDICTED: peptidoglycan recognition protein 3-like [Colobus angolensis palliatus]|uniref:peptidoglycan recognition protein 3-like n=1 Tax=Colobus angolensis palliatus TaxID=336983 RepID=UPI0005F4F39A|nr:PREDICTED: peptidoglycan recognition protein 3-like [Colobus angolensis palliatus]